MFDRRKCRIVFPNRNPGRKKDAGVRREGGSAHLEETQLALLTIPFSPLTLLGRMFRHKFGFLGPVSLIQAETGYIVIAGC